jgi:hypothetical protein
MGWSRTRTVKERIASLKKEFQPYLLRVIQYVNCESSSSNDLDDSYHFLNKRKHEAIKAFPGDFKIWLWRVMFYVSYHTKLASGEHPNSINLEIARKYVFLVSQISFSFKVATSRMPRLDEWDDHDQSLSLKPSDIGDVFQDWVQQAIAKVKSDDDNFFAIIHVSGAISYLIPLAQRNAEFKDKFFIPQATILKAALMKYAFHHEFQGSKATQCSKWGQFIIRCLIYIKDHPTASVSWDMSAQDLLPRKLVCATSAQTRMVGTPSLNALFKGLMG